MIKKKREYVIVGTLPPQAGGKNRGGVANVVWNESLAMKMSGLDVCILGIGRHYSAYREVSGIPIFGPSKNPLVLVRALSAWFSIRSVLVGMRCKDAFRLLASIHSLISLMRQIEVSVVHVHHLHNQMTLAIKKLYPNIRVVATVHSYTEVLDSITSQTKLKTIANQNLQLALVDHVTHVSRTVSAQGQRLGIHWSCPSSVVPNGISGTIESFPVQAVDDYSVGQVCFAGALIGSKGLERLIHACALISEMPVSVEVAGLGPLREVLDDLARKLGVNTRWCGFLDTHSLFGLMRESQIFVMPSASESFGLVYLESLYCGTPCIGYAPVMRELTERMNLSGSLTAWLTPFDPERESNHALAEKMVESLQIKSRRLYMQESREIRDRVLCEFNWNKIAQQYVEKLDAA